MNQMKAFYQMGTIQKLQAIKFIKLN